MNRKLRSAGWVVALAVGLTSARAKGEEPARAPAGRDACGPAGVDEGLLPRLRRGESLDVHNLAVTLDVLCPADASRDRRHIVDALSLFALDEPLRARAQLFAVAHDAAEERTRRWAAIVLAWSFLRDGDRDAFATRLGEVEPEARARLTLLAHADNAPAFASDLGRLRGVDRTDLERLGAEYRATRHTKRPWLAGVFSAALPGAGQVYAGSWQGAAVAFVLNGALIGATAELAARRLYLPATAAGFAASFFYVGNIFNAADLAEKRNQRAAADPYRELESRLVPEARP